MGFSIKLAPGVRVRASSRGVRTSLGPRAARIHVGAGRAGVSTGIGPIGYYSSLNKPKPRSSSSGSVNRQIAAAAREQAQADKAAEADRLRAALAAIYNVHQQSFEPAQRIVVQAPPEPPLKQVRGACRAQARQATRFFDRAARRRALDAADEHASSIVSTMGAEIARQAVEQQRRLDADWAGLKACVPDVVLPTLAAAFADNEAAASAVGIEGSEVSLVVVVPPTSHLPERTPALTKAGNLSLKKLTKTESAEIYKHLVCGHLVVTLRETFAVVPGLTSARIAVVRPTAADAYGSAGPEAIAVARCSRAALSGVRWESVDSVQVVNDCCTEQLFVEKGVTRALQPIPLSKQSELRAVLDAVDLGEEPELPLEE